MKTIEGKYGRATVMLSDDYYPEESVVTQLYAMLNHPKFSGKIVIMPDCHSGKGSVIGFTMPVSDSIVPNVVGVDISCGMLVVELESCPNLEELDKFINNNIPSGHNIHDRPLRFIKDYIGSRYDELKDDFINLSVKVGQRVKPMESLGSLGGGKYDCHRTV